MSRYYNYCHVTQYRHPCTVPNYPPPPPLLLHVLNPFHRLPVPPPPIPRPLPEMLNSTEYSVNRHGTARDNIPLLLIALHPKCKLFEIERGLPEYLETPLELELVLSCFTTLVERVIIDI